MQVGRRGVVSRGTPQPERVVANRRRAVRLHPVAAAAVAAQQHGCPRHRHLAAGHHHAAISHVANDRAAVRRGRPVDFALLAGQPHGPVVAVLPGHVDHVRHRGAGRDVKNAVLVVTDHDRVFGGLVVAAAEIRAAGQAQGRREPVVFRTANDGRGPSVERIAGRHVIARDVDDEVRDVKRTAGYRQFVDLANVGMARQRVEAHDALGRSPA